MSFKGKGYGRRNARLDANQGEIVAKLNSIAGVSAIPIGKPVDVLVGVAGFWYGDEEPRNYLLEIKNPAQYPSARKLTADQREFFTSWPGKVAKVETIDEALEALELPHVIWAPELPPVEV